MSCCTLGVGVCVMLYTKCRCMYCVVHCVCVCVVQRDGTGMYETVWVLVVDIEG